MSASANKSYINQDINLNKSRYRGVQKRAVLSEISRSVFTYSVSPIGVSAYVSDKAVAIILLESTHNLRWKSMGLEEVAVNCAAGTVLLLPALHEVTIEWSEPVEILKIVMMNEKDELLLELGDIPSRIISFSSRECLQLSQLVLEPLREQLTSEDGYLKSLSSVLRHLLLRNAKFVRSVSGLQSGLSSYACRQIENFLKDNFSMQVSVPEMAIVLGMSAGHFSTCFRESFGITPHQYLMGLRLDQAEKYLVETDMPIIEIAAQLNFSSQSHLTTALKKYRKLTPGEVRRRGSQCFFRPMPG